MLLLITGFSSGVSAQTNRQPSQVGGLRGTYAPIHSGKVAVLGHNLKRERRWEIAAQVEFRKLNSGPADYMESIRGKTGTGEVTFIDVPNTLYSFILLNGAVQPLILEAESWEVWEVNGLGKYFLRCHSITPGERQMAFGGVEGLADVWLRWHFEFMDKERGPRVRFTVEGG